MARVLSRLGRFCAQHRWAVVAVWSAVLAAFAITALTGMRFNNGAFEVPGTPSSEAMAVLAEEFPSTGDDTGTLELVVQNPDGAITDPAAAAAVNASLEFLRTAPDVVTVSDPFDPQRPYLSQDGSTAVSTVTIAGDADQELAQQLLVNTADGLRADGLRVEVGGALGDGIPQILGPSEIAGALLAFLVLLVTFGSLVAAGANMLSALTGVGVGILGVLAFSAITPIGNLTPVLAVMLGLAVGIDYTLFILARYRAELRHGSSVMDAIGTAIGTAGSSVVFAAATVVIALTGLALVGIPFIGEMGLAAAFTVVIAVLVALTLVPALLSFMGRRALPRREGAAGTHSGNAGNSAPGGSQGAFVNGWVNFVTKHRAVSVLGAALVLTTASLPVLSMQTALKIPGGEDSHSTQRAAYNLVASEFGPGAQDPLVVLVRADNVQGALPDVMQQLGSLPDVQMIAPAGVSADGDTAMLTIFSKHGPLDSRTTDLVHALRSQSGVTDGASVLVTGATAIGLDSDQQLRSALILYIGLIVGLSIVLMIILFRSLLIPLVATAGFLLSLGTGLGATVAVFQWGWFDFALPAPQGNPLLSLLPICVAGILFGLAMDYQVFLVSRMHEAHQQGLSPLEAIRSGFRHSAIIVIAAAAIMGAVFGGFAMSHSSFVASIALALMVGVLADAFIVRMIVIPAALALLGRSAWWIPKWLDKVLPVIDVEGSALSATGGPQPAGPLEPARESVGAGAGALR